MRSNRISFRAITHSLFGLRVCFEHRRTHCGSFFPPAISSIVFSITLAQRTSVAVFEGASTKILTAWSHYSVSIHYLEASKSCAEFFSHGTPLCDAA